MKKIKHTMKSKSSKFYNPCLAGRQAVNPDTDKVSPPNWILSFFRRFCNPNYVEDIEGDLLERFEKLNHCVAIRLGHVHEPIARRLCLSTMPYNGFDKIACASVVKQVGVAVDGFL